MSIIRRIYADIPADIDEKLAAKARELGLTKKALLEKIINEACVVVTVGDKRKRAK